MRKLIVTLTIVLVLSSVLQFITVRAQEPSEAVSVGVPRIGVLVADYDLRNTWHDILHAFLNHFGIAEFLTLRNVTEGILSNYDIIVVAGDFMEKRYLLRDLAYIPGEVLVKINGFSDSGNGVLWFSRAGFYDENGKFMWKVPEQIEEILGVRLAFSWSGSVKARFIENHVLTDGLSVTKFELPREDWTYIDVKASKANVIAYFTYELPASPSRGLIATYDRELGGRSGYFLYNPSLDLPEAYYDPVFWRKLMLWLANLDLKHYVELPPFFDHQEMKSYWSAFTIRRDDWLISNDERILELGLPISLAAVTEFFNWDAHTVGYPRYMSLDESVGEWYRRLYGLYELEVSSHSHKHTENPDIAANILDINQSLKTIEETFGFQPLGFAPPGGVHMHWWNNTVLAPFSPPLVYGSFYATYYPANIGWSTYSGIIDLVKDPDRHWMLSRGKVPYEEAWRMRFTQAARLGLSTSTSWHIWAVSRYKTYWLLVDNDTRIFDESIALAMEREGKNIVRFDDPLENILDFLKWAKTNYSDRVWFTTLGRVALLARMRNSVDELKGFFNLGEYTLNIRVDRDVYGLPLKVHGNIGRVEVDGKPYPFYKDDVVVLPLLNPGMHNIKVIIGDPEKPHINGIKYKQPFLPRITHFALDSSDIALGISQDPLYVANYKTNVTLQVNMINFVPRKVLVNGTEWSDWTYDDVTSVVRMNLLLEQESRIKILYEKAIFLEVRVTDGEGHPVPLAKVMVDGLSRITGLSGVSLFDKLPSGESNLSIIVQGKIVYDKVVNVGEISSIIINLHNVILARLTIRVKAGDAYVPNAEVTVRSAEGQLKIRTDDIGKVDVALATGTYEVEVFNKFEEVMLDGNLELVIQVSEVGLSMIVYILPTAAYIASIALIFATFIKITRLRRPS